MEEDLFGYHNSTKWDVEIWINGGCEFVDKLTADDITELVKFADDLVKKESEESK